MVVEGWDISLAVHGQPRWSQTVLTVIELVLPLVLLWLAGAGEKAADLEVRDPEPTTSAKRRNRALPG